MVRVTKTGAFKWPVCRAVNPRMLKTILKIIPSGSSVIDIGAGRGRYVEELLKRGYVAKGFDGSPFVVEATEGRVERADLTGDLREYYRAAQWGLFIEVGEHVPEEFFDGMMAQLVLIPTEGMIVSWATPGQPGKGHINCKTPVFIASQFAIRGWLVDEESTKQARSTVDKRAHEKIMVLRKKS